MADFLAAQRQAHLCCGVLAHSVPADGAFHFWQAMPAEPTAYAHELYGALRALDQRQAALIVIESPPDTPAWAAVLDRLRRAAFQKTAASSTLTDRL
jgi:L-threonylcarbamoyladenylate synthase